MRTLMVATLATLMASGLAGAAGKHASGKPTIGPAQMNQHFTQAREAFLEKDNKAAARHIRAGEAVVRQEAKQATGEEKDNLVASAGDLEQLAGDVEKGKVESVDRLNREFARADIRLADHYQKLAAQSWEQKHSSAAGRALDTAASYFESATSWTGEKAEDVVHSAKTVSGKLVHGAKMVPKEVGDAIADLGRGIKRLGQKIEPGNQG